MMDRRETDFEAIAWPGFVDILSNVVIVFVFLIMITAVTLSEYVIEYKSELKKAMVADVQSDQVVKLEESVKQLEKKLMESERDRTILMEELSSYEQMIQEYGGLKENFSETESDHKSISPVLQSSSEQKISFSEADKTMVVFFETKTITLAEEARVELSGYFDRYLADVKAGKVKVELTSSKQPESLTQTAAKSLAVARLLNVRNYFLDLGIPGTSIAAYTVEPEEIEGSHAWVRIRITGP